MEIRSEPWATLAQLSLIFAQFFAFAGRVVKRHGKLTGVEAPAAGMDRLYLAFRSDVIKFEVALVLNSILPKLHQNNIGQSRPDYSLSYKFAYFIIENIDKLAYSVKTIRNWKKCGGKIDFLSEGVEEVLLTELRTFISFSRRFDAFRADDLWSNSLKTVKNIWTFQWWTRCLDKFALV